MVTDWWDQPVRVLIGNNLTYHVTRPDKAAELLLEEWPDQRGPAFARAQEAVLAAMEDPDSHSARLAARMAFEAAAREADILLESGH